MTFTPSNEYQDGMRQARREMARDWKKRYFVLFAGKARDLTKERIAKAWAVMQLENTRPVEPLETVDFSGN